MNEKKTLEIIVCIIFNKVITEQTMSFLMKSKDHLRFFNGHKRKKYLYCVCCNLYVDKQSLMDERLRGECHKRKTNIS